MFFYKHHIGEEKMGEKERISKMIDDFLDIDDLNGVPVNIAEKEITRRFLEFIKNLNFNIESKEAVITLQKEEDGFTKRAQVLNMLLSYLIHEYEIK